VTRPGRRGAGAGWRKLARSAGETEAVGAALADAMPIPADGPAILYLSGELGAGKTTLARGFLRRRGLAGPAPSPTFALLECYGLTDLVVVHVDLYRLREPQELESLGLRMPGSSNGPSEESGICRPRT
jgi:tRNA threonylcarbamoyladenosine biosynthesis protein TsaE